MNAGQRDILERLRGETNVVAKYNPDAGQSTIAVLWDAIEEIEQLRALRDEWVNHGIDDIDRLDLDGLRCLLTRLSDRVDELLAERGHEPSVTAYGLGYDAGVRSAEQAGATS